MLLFHIKPDRKSYEFLAGFKMDIGVGRCHVLSYRKRFFIIKVFPVL